MATPKKKTTNRKSSSTSFFARNKRIVIIGIAFAAVGVAALVRSFAATPDACTNSYVKVFNSGPCVQIVKALVNTNAGSNVVDTNNAGFDGPLNNALIDLNSKGIFAACGGYVTATGVTPCLYNLMKDRAAIIQLPPTPKKITAKNTPPRTYQTITKLNTKDAKKLHVNVWVNNNKVVDPAGKSGKWTLHLICDINVYQNVGKYGVWTYARGEQQKGGSDTESCTMSRNGITHWSCLSAVGLAKQNGLCQGTDGEGDRFVPAQLARQGYKNYLRFKGAGVY